MYRLYGTHRWWFCAYEIIHFQVFIGTCRLFYFAFYGWTSDIDALTKLQYALWNKRYKIHLPCLQCLLTHCYCTIQWGQQLVTRAPMQPQHWGNVTTCHIGINAKPFHEPPPHTWALNHYICLAMLMQVASSGSLKFHTPLKCQYKQLLMSPFLS